MYLHVDWKEGICVVFICRSFRSCS